VGGLRTARKRWIVMSHWVKVDWRRYCHEAIPFIIEGIQLEGTRPMMVTVNIQLPDELTQEAQSLGLLSGDKIAGIIRDAVQRERLAAWQELQKILEPVQAEFRGDYRDLDDDGFMKMVQEVVLEVREEMHLARTGGTAPKDSVS
jgi:post-segregation antitoxin (ccd killing protein)